MKTQKDQLSADIALVLDELRLHPNSTSLDLSQYLRIERSRVVSALIALIKRGSVISSLQGGYVVK